MNDLTQTFQVYWWVLGLAYLMGAIPFGLIITKLFLGFDVRERGSGNIGMTNVMRTAGKWPGIVTFLLDFGKGAAAVFLAKYLAPEAPVEWYIVPGVAAILGHTRSIFLRFSGGKGVATNFGIWLALDWRIFLVGVSTWLLIFLWKRISSLSAITSLILLPIVIFALYGNSLTFGGGLLLSIYILALHKDNIQRILQGKEGILKKE